MNITYPDLLQYRANFIQSGVNYPLKKVEFKAEGLLTELPKPTKKGWPWDVETDPKVYDPNLSWPKITIVTPSYNQGIYIEETIRAVLLQNYPNLEYIVIDGGSTDQTKEILEKYSPWISFWQSEKDDGQGHAINKGFSLASGEIYGWINSDDYYMYSSFYTLANAFRNSKINLIYGDGLNLTEETGQMIYQKGSLVLERYLFVGGVILQHSCFWRSKIHQPILEALYCAVDSELWFRLIPKEKIKHVKYPLGISRTQAEAKTYNERFEEKWKKDNKLISEIHQFEKKITFFKYFLSRFFKQEVKYVQGIYKALNFTDTSKYLSNKKS